MVNEDTYEIYQTVLFNKWIVGKYEPIDSEYNGFINKRGILVLLNKKLVSKYINDVKDMWIWNLSGDDADLLMKEYPSMFKSTRKAPTLIHKVDNEFIALTGHKYKKIRNAHSRYKNIVTISNKLNNEADVLKLINDWKTQRDGVYFRFTLSGEKYFMSNHINNKSLENLYFYIDDKLIGYSVIEKIDNFHYNLLFRKVDLDYSQLTYYIDYISYKNVFEKSKLDYIRINCGDASYKNLLYYKERNFNIDGQFMVTSLQLKNSNTIKKLF